jgi:hypothetical protein
MGFDINGITLTSPAPGTLTVQALVVAGGGPGSGSIYGGGGGGGGGVIFHSAMVLTPGSITVTVGNGGSPGSPGQDSYFGAMRAFGGGRPVAGGAAGGEGGSGAGCTHSLSGAGGASTQTSNNGGTGYGNAGGAMVYVDPYWPGSGGGAGAAGTTSGAGGVGALFVFDGVYYNYGGGGGSCNNSGSTTAGGTGGGGAGVNGGNGISGTANTGGGGGGSKNGTGGSGGSGIVVIRYPGAQKATGGTVVTNSAGFTTHTFTSSGTFVVGGLPSSNTLVITNNSKTMTFNPSGKVILPGTPVFNASGTALVWEYPASISWVVPTFSSVLYNVGSCFNGSTGTFTAPITGLYMFTFTGYATFNTGGIAEYIHPTFLVNGTWASRRGGGSTGYRLRHHGWGPNDYYKDCEISEIFRLQAGDYLYLYLYHSTTTCAIYSNYKLFTGVYLG